MLTVYKASAGSGKTFRLAYEYIRLALSYTDAKGQRRLRLPQPGAEGLHRVPGHRSILAITFTNKATDEMKRRIVHELALLAGREPGWDFIEDRNELYTSRLCGEFGCTVGQLRQAAELALDNLLNDFGGFAVSTIDSFFQTVLRTFAREAELAGNYEIVLDNKSVLAYAVGDMISDISKKQGVAADPDNKLLIGAIETLMNREMEDGRAFDLLNRDSKLHAEIIDFFTKINDETFQLHQDAMVDYLADPLRIVRFSNAVSTHVQTSLKRMQQLAATALEVVGPESGRFAAKTLNVLRTGMNGEPVKDSNKTFPLMLQGEIPLKGKTPPSPEALAAVETATRAMGYFNRECVYFTKLADNLYRLVLLGRLLEHIKRFRRENAAIMLSDTNEIIARIIGDDESPFIYERIGLRLRNFLLDEFQDTSRLQWKNLLPLVGDSCATGEDSLVIGDVKQCIYRFRNSDPTLLGTLASNFPPEVAREEAQSPETNSNWRSCANVVRVNNAFFENLCRLMPTLGGAYEGVAQHVSPPQAANPKGYVKCMLYGPAITHDLHEPVEENPGQPWLSSFFNGAALLAAAEIERELRLGYPPSSIAVLFRTNSAVKEFALQLQDYIANVGPSSVWYGVKVSSEEGLTLQSSDAVKLVVAILRFVSAATMGNKTVSERKTADLASLFHDFRKAMTMGGASPEQALEQAMAMRDLRQSRAADISRESAVEVYEAERIEESERRLNSLRELPLDPDCVTLTALVNRVIREFVPADTLKGENTYLQAFQDAVGAYAASHPGSCDLRRFLRWWDGSGCKTSVADGNDSQAINVMTIHKAKGLEYECVHVPWSKFKIPGKKYFWDNPDVFGFVDDPADVPPLVPVTEYARLDELPVAYKNTYLKRVKDGIVDEANVLYVAMTRAVSELCLYIPDTDARTPAKLPEGLMSVENGMLLNVIGLGEMDFAGDPLRMGLEANPEATRWTAGSPMRYQAKKASKPTALEPSFKVEMPSEQPYDPAEGSRLKGVATLDRSALRKFAGDWT